MTPELNAMVEVFTKNDLYLIPLHSIKDNKCSCGNLKCTSKGKHPFFRYNWKRIATNDGSKILNWFNKYQSVNFGVATGRKSAINGKYLTVVDVDQHDHPILEKLPRTFCYQTGSGGYHFWYWSDLPVRNSVSSLAPKVDIRGKNGYVIVPPSKHLKGSYKFIHGMSQTIEPLPRFIVEHIKTSASLVRSSKKTKTKPREKVLNDWTILPVPQVRDMLESKRIPLGVRNTTIHRLLSSDRCKGLGRTALMKQAIFYRSRCEQGLKDISNAELTNLVSSVMKYPAYNNSHEKVNENWFQWVNKKSKKKISSIEIEAFSKADYDFFNSLRISETQQVPLSVITEQRKKTLQKQGFMRMSSYRPQLLAKKLTEMGFERKRTSRGNTWNVEFG